MTTLPYAATVRPAPDPMIGSGMIRIFAWTGMGLGDDGAPLEINGNLFDLSIQAFGDFSGDATVGWEGSNDGVHWSPQKDETGAVIALGPDASAGVSKMMALFRPIVRGGDGETEVDVVIAIRMAS